jgi:hypothetical protein
MGALGGTRPRGDAVTAVAEPCVFVLWASARREEERILSDLRERFALAEVVELEWPADAFSRNLTRLYGEALPPGSAKEEESGNGPFLVVVALDRRPRYGLRRTTRGWRSVNVHATAAKRRYRRWTGHGFRVHGSVDRLEAERDLRLLLSAAADSVLGLTWDGTVRRIVADTLEWPSVDDLVSAIASATPTSVVRDDDDALVVRTDEVWWAAVIAGGDAPAADARELRLSVTIGGVERALRLEASSPPT